MGFFDKWKQSEGVQKITRVLNSIKIPGLQGITLFQLLSLYVEGIKELELGNRASAVSWRLFTGLFPFMMFFILLIQYLPYYDVIEQYFYAEVLQKILPASTVDDAWNYISERQLSLNTEYKNSGFFSILFAIFIFLAASTAGINSLIKGLNFSESDTDRDRGSVRQFSTAFYLTFLLSLIFIIGMLVLYYVDVIGNILAQTNLTFFNLKSAFGIIKYIIFSVLIYFAISSIYYIGPKQKLKYKEVIPGAVFTTLLFLISIYIFSNYITNVVRYNLLYGSLGTILIIMIGLYLNVMLVIIGYQLNITILQSRKISNHGKC